jgi:hypothetical protein
MNATGKCGDMLGQFFPARKHWRKWMDLEFWLKDINGLTDDTGTLKSSEFQEKH